ncbi:MAG: PfkB family carbohydrate kinase [Elusimicrobiales bacterium]|nr:PfkB family carbohydrate kinase [Elusimicrobiales bacterium]
MNALIVNLNLAVDKTALVPRFAKGRVFRLGGTVTLPGGKGVNVARALRSLGLETPVAGFVSGHNGRWITEAMRKEGFKTYIEAHEAGESRVCYTVVDSGGRATDLNEEGPDVPAAAQARFLRLYSGLAPKFRVAAVCGRVSSGLKKGFYASLVRLAAARGCFTMFDTSGPVLAEALAAGAEGIKINREEFEELSGAAYTPARLHSFFKKHAPGGLKTLIVTDGAGHTHAASPFGLWRVTPPRLARLKSPTGAGDSFMAGFLFGFINGYDFERTLKLATGASASDCLTLGAGLINRTQTLTYAARTRVVKLA